MTVETAIKIEGDKCGVEMRNTCEDPSPKSVGGGDSKDDYVFVNDCDVTSDDHGEVEGNGDELNDVDASETISNLQGSIERGDLLDSCNGFGGKVDDNVVMVNGGELKLENVIVVEEESGLVKENGEIMAEKESVIEEREVVVESDDRINNEGEVDVEDHDLEVVESGDRNNNEEEVDVGDHDLEVVESGDRNNNEGEVDVEDRDLDVVEGSNAKSKADEETVVEKGDECNVSVDNVECPLLDNGDNIDDGSDKLQNGSANVELEPQLPCGEIEEPVQLEENKICTKEPEKQEDEVRKPEVIEDYVNSHICEVLVNVSESVDDVVEESKPIEADVVRQSQEDGRIDIQPPDGETKVLDSSGAEVLLLDDAITEESADCQLQDLQPADNGELSPVETEADVREEGDSDPSQVNGVQDLETLDSEATTFDLQQENQDATDLTPESEECQEPQGVPEKSEGVDNESNLALTASELDGSARESTGQCDETTTESTQEVTGTSDTSTVIVQSDKLDKPVDDHESDMVHGEGRVEVIAQVERSLECSVLEDSPMDQVEEDTGLDDVVDTNVSSEDASLNKATTVEETVNSSMLKSADEAVAADESKDRDVSDLEDGVPLNDAPVSESSHESGSSLTSEGGDLTVPLGSQVVSPVPHDTDMVNEQGVVDDGSYVGEASFQAELENSSDVLPSSVDTELEVKPANDDVHDLSREICDSEGTLIFGSFVCQTKSNGVSSSVADVNAQIITDGVSAPPLEGSAVSTSLSDANPQIVLDEVQTSSLERSPVSTSPSDANPQIVTDGVSASPQEESEANFADGETVDPARSPFRWLIRVPRLDDVEFEQIKKFQVELDKKTQARDDFRKVLVERMAIYQEVKNKFHAAKAEERNAHQLMMAKKKEIDAAQSLLKLARDGNTVERIDGQILNMERRIQHETMDLTEEKKLIREIKLLNHQRERLAADTQGQQEVYQAVGRRVETEEQLKVLRKEMDALRDNHGKAFERFKAAERKFEEESILKRKVEAEKDSLARIRQEAYEHFQTLKKQAYEKNKPCYNYRDAKKDVLNLKAGEDESLERICVEQVENFMKMWNENDEFRKEYIRCNKRSTLRRFNTLDGRDLGIDEKKPSLEDSSYNGLTSAKVNTVTTATSEREFPLIVKKAKEDDSSNKVSDQKNTNAVSKKKGEIISNNGLGEPSGRIETEEKEVPKLTKEEEELARKAEQKRIEEEAELLKEQCRLEEKAKAQEALERKKRMAEKAQARAKFKAEKEAEEKKKEREKRAKKKGKKKGLASDPTEVEPAQVPESSSETIREPEVTEKPVTVVKKSHKPTALYTKQVKTIKSIPAPPAPLRNRGKRRIPQWAWWLVLAIVAALLIFPLGNIDIVGLLKPYVSGSY